MAMEGVSKIAGRTTGAMSDHTRTTAAANVDSARADMTRRSAGTANRTASEGSSKVPTPALAAMAGTASVAVRMASALPTTNKPLRVLAVDVGGRSRMAPMMLNRLMRTLVNRMVTSAMTSPMAAPLTMLVGVTANEI